ncbi:bacteriocin class II with double-glycine leader peptide family protein [Streptococcus pseudoporcinus]|uniref:Bacteriocin class II with double-glycine leader peptide family protein n=1 Tax=Streptococcus pseudoporcinus TaxID=361101 RepID=A0A4U9Z7T1_9STRE|nr:class IIb bacteriocin, lactobin A/cerein 7B family [Streptococcus pseudoporcinus]VTS35194.1 bacteriocin class II with double-glycine leader peptide family protein [Streptococcus pseudoporcinus]
MKKYKELQKEELVGIWGGKGNIGSAIGGCLGGVLIASAGGPITGGAAAFVCVVSGIVAYQ